MDLHNVRDHACQSATLLGKDVAVARSPDNRFFQLADSGLQLQISTTFVSSTFPTISLSSVR